MLQCCDSELEDFCIIWMLKKVLNFSLNLWAERRRSMFSLSMSVATLLCRAEALQVVCFFAVRCLLWCVCVLSHSFPCPFRPHRAPSPNLPHHSVSASPVSQGYKRTPRVPFCLPQMSMLTLCSDKNGPSQLESLWNIIFYNWWLLTCISLYFHKFSKALLN